MKKEEVFQIQRGDYFLYHGEVVKVTGRSPYNENHYTVVNKNGSKFYAEVEELEPIVLNEYVFNQIGVQKISKENFAPRYVSDTFNCTVREWSGDEHRIDYISVAGNSIFIWEGFAYLHFLQNALRLFGVEVELKQ